MPFDKIKRLQDILEANPVPTIITRMRDGLVKYANAAIGELVGLPSEKIVGQITPDFFVHPEEREPIMRELADKGRVKEQDIYCKRGDGEFFWARVSFTTLDFDGEPSVMATVYDISEQKKALDNLQASEKKYRALIEHSSDAIFIADAETGRIAEVNKQAELLMGVPQEQLIGMHQSELHPPEDAALYKQRFCERAASGKVADDDIFLQRSDGKKVPVNISVSPIKIDGKKFILGSFRDISERMTFLNDLQKSQQRLQSILEGIPIPAIVTRIEDGYVLYANAEIAKLVGVSIDEAIGKKTPDFFVHPEDRKLQIKVLAEKGNIYGREAQLKKADGSQFYGLCSVVRIDFDGVPATLSTVVDISKQKKAEKALEESRAFFKHLVDSNPIPTVVTRVPDGEVLFANQGIRDVFWLGNESFSGLFSPDYYVNPKVRDLIMERILAEGSIHNQEVELLRQDGSHFWALGSGTLIDFGDEKSVVISVSDISERKHRELFEVDQRNILEMIANSEVSLSEVLEEIVFTAQRQRPGMLGSILLLDADGKHLLHSVAPDLPQAYSDAINGVEIGPNVSSCGTAAFIRQRVIVSDIATDPLWADYKDLALPHGLAACWSEPIVSHGKVLGTFALYYHEPKAPDAGDIASIERIAALAENAISHKQAEEALRETQKRLIQAQYIAQLGDFTWDIETGRVSWSKGMHRLLKYDPDEQIDYDKVNAEIHHPDDLERVTAWLNAAIAAGKPELPMNEYRVICKDGEVKCFETNGMFVLEDGKAVRLFGTCHDITERKQAEQAYREEAERNELILQSSMDGVIIADEKGDIVQVNPAYCEMVGYSEKELASMNIVQLEALLTPEQVGEKIGRMMQEGSTRFESQHRHRDGHVVDLDVSIFVMQAEGQKPLVSAFVRDISDTKRAAERLRRILDAEFDGVIVHQNMRVVFSNKAAQQMFGFASLEATIGVNPQDFMDPRFKSLAAAIVRKVIRTGRPSARTELGAVHQVDGHIFPMEVTNTPIIWEGRSVVVSIVRDITERKLAEQRLRTIVEANPLATAVTRFKGGQVLYANQAVGDLFHLEEDPVLQLRARQLYVDPEQRRELLSRIELDHLVRDYQVKVRRPDGTTFIASLTASRMKFENEDAIMAVFTDQTERINADLRLKTSELRYRNLVDMLPDALLVHQQGRIVFANKGAAGMLGVETPEEMIGQSVIEFLDPKFRQAVLERMAQLLTDHESVPSMRERFVRADGEGIWVDVTAIQTEFDGQPAIMALCHDVTAEQEMEEQFRQAQKMEAVGTMAGGIAHDFNNMLAGMLGQLFLLKKEIKDRPDSIERIDKVERQGMRAAEIIQQMLTFARKSRTEMHAMPLAALLKETMKLHAVALPESIMLQMSFEYPEITINGDAAMIQQVVLNLLGNARDALAETKDARIVMALEPVSMQDEVYQRHAELQGKPLVCLTVADNGEGIPDSLQSNIFDPFFTTKEVGKGTGLGLAMVYGAMQTHGGAVVLQSELGQGTEFRLYFPRLDEAVCMVEEARSEAVPGDDVGVLVADDETDLREIMSEALGNIGYRVFAAADGEQALALYAEHRDEIAIAILDVVMPKMGGADACLELRKIDPELPVLFHTGYGQDVLVDDIMSLPLIESITKPASIEQLTGKLAYLLHLKKV